jgi:streptogramin lyase
MDKKQLAIIVLLMAVGSFIGMWVSSSVSTPQATPSPAATPTPFPGTNAPDKSEYLHYLENESDPHGFTMPFSVYELCNPKATEHTISGAEGFNVSFKEAKRGKLLSSSVFVWHPEFVTKTLNESRMVNYGSNATPDWRLVESFREVTDDLSKWIPFDPQDFKVKKKECVKIKVQGFKKAGLGESSVDNVVSFAGFDFPEFAWWNSSFLERTSFTLNSSYDLNLSAVLLNLTGLSVPSLDCGKDLRVTNGTDFELTSLNVVQNGTTVPPVGSRWCIVALLVNLTSTLNQTFYVYDNNSFAVPPVGYDKLYLVETFDNRTDGAFVNKTNGWYRWTGESPLTNFTTNSTFMAVNESYGRVSSLSARVNWTGGVTHFFVKNLTDAVIAPPIFFRGYFRTEGLTTDWARALGLVNASMNTGVVAGHGLGNNVFTSCATSANCWSGSVTPTTRINFASWYQFALFVNETFSSNKVNFEVSNATVFAGQWAIAGLGGVAPDVFRAIYIMTGYQGALNMYVDDLWVWNRNFMLANSTPEFNIVGKEGEINVSFIAPTLANDSILQQDFAFVNVSANMNVTSCTLNWNTSLDFSTPNVWVSRSPNIISRINSSNGVVSGNFTVQSTLSGIAVDMSGNVWVANHVSSTVSKLTPYDGKVVGSYTVQGSPHGVAADALGNVWVTNDVSHTVSRVNASNGNVTGNFTVQSTPYGVAADKRGNIWVANYDSNTISRVNASNGNVSGNFTVPGWPNYIAADAIGNMWVTNFDLINNFVSRVNASNGNVTGNFTVQTTPYGVAADVLGNLWVANTASNTVSRVNASNGNVTGNFTVQTWPTGVAVDAGGNVWAVNFGSGTISRINASNGNVSANFTIGSASSGTGDLTGFALRNFVMNQTDQAASFSMTVQNGGAATFAYYNKTGLSSTLSSWYYVSCISVSSTIVSETRTLEYDWFPQVFIAYGANSTHQINRFKFSCNQSIGGLVEPVNQSLTVPLFNVTWLGPREVGVIFKTSSPVGNMRLYLNASGGGSNATLRLLNSTGIQIISNMTAGNQSVYGFIDCGGPVHNQTFKIQADQVFP